MSGLVSRRKAEELIRSGRVKINGVIVRELGTKAVWGKDDIRLDGNEIPDTCEKAYIILNKPFGYICSLKDPEGRPIVVDLLRDVHERVYPVGRLDFDTIGLLLLTNDGDFSYRLTHPRYHVTKTYKATVSGRVSNEQLLSLRKGVLLDDGFSGHCKAVLVRQNNDKSMLRITITHGRNRLVRRMMEQVGLKTVQLIRTGFGSLELGRLKIGEYRHLDPDELQALRKMIGLSQH